MQAAGRSLIIVEDEVLISLMVEDMAADLGWAVAGAAQTQSAALTLLESCTPHLALLDVDLGSTSSFAVMDACRARNIPMVFITGYMSRDLPDHVRDGQVLAKPFSTQDLAGAIRLALAPGEQVPEPSTTQA